MEIVYACCCGLDVHKKIVVACVLTATAEGTVHKEVRTFSTMTQDLVAMADWLTGSGVTHVAMERTGVYWKPVYNLLEDFRCCLAVGASGAFIGSPCITYWKGCSSCWL